jgi:GH18 family chitinase
MSIILVTNLIMQEFRTAINAEAASSGKAALLLTIAVSAGKTNIDNGYEVSKISPWVTKYFDYYIVSQWHIRQLGQTILMIA